MAISAGNGRQPSPQLPCSDAQPPAMLSVGDKIACSQLPSRQGVRKALPLGMDKPVRQTMRHTGSAMKTGILRVVLSR